MKIIRPQTKNKRLASAWQFSCPASLRGLAGSPECCSVWRDSQIHMAVIVQLAARRWRSGPQGTGYLLSG